MANFATPIPNGPFYSVPSYSISQPYTGSLVVGTGLSVTSGGTLLSSSTAGGTVSSITAGPGLSGGTITTSGTISLLPPTPTMIGGVRAGANVTIDAAGIISVASPGIGTITGITPGQGISGGGTSGNVTVSVKTATTSQLGGIIVGSTLSISSGVLDAPVASSSTPGLALYASSAEVIAGVLSNKAVTPAALSAKVASTSELGLVRLSDSVTSASSTTAATSAAVKVVADAVATVQTSLATVLPKSGGTMTGNITFAPTQTFPPNSIPYASSNQAGVVIVGDGLSITSTGYLSTIASGTVTSITMGEGLGAPATGDVITGSGVMRLLPPTSDTIGGVKPGDNIEIAVDGTIQPSGVLLLNNGAAYNSYVFPVQKVPGEAPGSNGYYLRLKNKITGEVEWGSGGNVSSIATGTGLTGGPITTTGTISLAESGVLATGAVPKTFGATGLIPTMTVDVYGRVTSAGQANPYAPFVTPTVSAPFNLVLDFQNNSTNYSFTLQGNTVLMNPSNLQSGQRGTIIITQNPITPYTLTFGSAWKFAGATPPTASTAASAVDVLDFVVVGSGYIVVLNYLKGVG